VFSALKNLFGGKAQLPSGRPDVPLSGDVRALSVGDVVNHDGSDFIVQGTLRFEEGGFRWSEHLLVDANRRIWLSVEDDEGELEVIEWQRSRSLGIAPGPRQLEHEDVTYELEERGTANYTSEGTTGAPGGGRAEYADYAAGDRRLSFERYSAAGEWEVSLGKKISEHALDVYPSRDGS
jgi:hypothetical protein